MPTDRWQAMWALYHGARALQGPEREAYLADQCDSPTLTDEVRRLLMAQPPAAFLESAAEADEPADLLVGSELDGFAVEGVLGEGGMGTVYLARESGSLTRPVAIKVVRRGMDTDRILRRFQAEQGLLARLDHPSIATVYRSGVTPDGRPYFVMQYVDGVPLDEYSRADNLGLGKRLELIANLCDVVQHTHQKGVIHRDLKPSNILVSLADGHPTLIDFGIAKAVISQETVLTREGQIIGTPDYMSPEQATGDVDNVDTRTDIFALGKLLAELTPGTRDRDLELVIAKSTASDRDQRYNTAAELAQDLRRLLAHQPIAARPPGRWYLVRKFVQRNPAGVTVGFAAILALAVGAIFLANLTIALRAALEESNAERAQSEQLAAFMLETFAGADPYVAAGETITARDLLDRGVDRIETSPAPALVRAQLLLTMGNTYRRLGVLDRAEAASQGVILLLKDGNEPKAMELRAAAHKALASLFEVQSKFEDQLVESRHAWELQKQLTGEQSEAATNLSAMGYALLRLGRYDDAETNLVRARELLLAAFGSEHESVANVHARLGSLYSALVRFDEAAKAYEYALQSNLARLGNVHPQVGSSYNNLAALQYRMGQYDKAALSYQAALAIQMAVHDPDHPSVSTIENNLAALFVRTGQPAEALPVALSALEKRRKILGHDNLEVGVTAYHAASAHRDLGQFAAADGLFTEAIAIVSNATGPQDRRLGVLMNGQAESLLRQGRLDEARVVAERALAINTAGWPAAHRQPPESKLLLARIAVATGDATLASRLANEARDAFAKHTGAPFEVALATAVLGRATALGGDIASGRRLIQSAVATLRDSPRGTFIDLDDFEKVLQPQDSAN